MQPALGTAHNVCRRRAQLGAAWALNFSVFSRHAPAKPWKTLHTRGHTGQISMMPVSARRSTSSRVLVKIST